MLAVAISRVRGPVCLLQVGSGHSIGISYRHAQNSLLVYFQFQVYALAVLDHKFVCSISMVNRAILISIADQTGIIADKRQNRDKIETKYYE
jgi:hypothetical protein